MPAAALLEPFRGPFGGVPPFDAVRTPDFKPALLQAMQLQRAELAAIAASAQPPSFANTIAAFEDSGRALHRVEVLLETFAATLNDAPMRAVEQELAPLRAAFQDEIVQDEALFARVRAVYEGRASAGLDPEQLRLTEVTYRLFARSGAALGALQKARLSVLNAALAELYTRFGQNQLDDEERECVLLDDPSQLAGLPGTLSAALHADAQARGHAGVWLVANTRSSAEPFLLFSRRRELRERVWRMWTSRGEKPGPTDNHPVIRQILALRAERAQLLGYPSHAHWVIDDNMAKTPEAAQALLERVWRAALAGVREELAELRELARADGHAELAPWDYRYYAEQLRAAKYDLDQNEVKPYLQLEPLREAAFWVAGELYGLRFAPLSGVPVYHPDVSVYEVTRGGEHVGLFYFDPYARAGKRSGAWMSEYRTQERFAGEITPIVSNNANFVKAQPGEPVLISWDDAVTLFHEFGHALHGLLSSVRYPSLACTNTLHDFVEFPSQLCEHWLATPELLARFARHYQTGEAIPRALVDKIRRARHFGQAFRTAEYVIAAIYDLRIHGAAAGAVPDPAEFERSIRAQFGAPDAVALRHRPTHFGHVFSGDDYAAGYYSYLWADTLVADAAEAFADAGFYDKATAERLEKSILSIGNAVHPERAYLAFRGRAPDSEALLRERGLLPQ